MVQDGCCSSGSSNGSGSGGSGGCVSEPTEAEEGTNTTERYPQRKRCQVDYNEQLNPTEDDHFICKYLVVYLNNNNNSENWEIYKGLPVCH